MANKNIDIIIKTALDNAGIKATEEQLDSLRGDLTRFSSGARSAGKETRESMIGAFKQIQRGAMDLFGFLKLSIEALKGGFKASKWFREEIIDPTTEVGREAKKSAAACKDFAETLAKTDANILETVKDQYKAIAKAIGEVTAARQRDNALFVAEIKHAREAADLQRNLAKQREINALDPTDKLGRADIERRYAAAAGQTDADRMKHDAVIERQKLEQEAADANSAADKIEATFEKTEAKILRLIIKANTQARLSKERNEADGTWYNKTKRTEAGDKIREAQKRESEDAKKAAKQLEDTLQQYKDQVAKLRASAADAQKRKDELWKVIENAETLSELATEKAVTAKVDAEKEAVDEYAKIIKERDEVEKKARLEMERDITKEKVDNLRKLHDEQLRKMDAEKKKLEENVSKLKTRGAENQMTMAQTINQADDVRKERQKELDASRFNVAKSALERRMANLGITDITNKDQIKKLGRMSNLDRATLERMQLEKQQADLKNLEKQKIKLAQDTKTEIEKMQKRLENLGL